MGRLITRSELRRLGRARQHLREASSDEALRVAVVAAMAGQSTAHFIRCFTAAFGETPHQYRTRMRLAQARLWLAQGRSVTRVCVDLGFSSLGSFSRLFAQHEGRPPSAWQRQMRCLVPAAGSIRSLLAPDCMNLMAMAFATLRPGQFPISLPARGTDTLSSPT